MKAIIIDDEQNCIESLAFDLKTYCPQVEVLDSCQSAKQGLLAIKNLQPELVFLDVQMPWMNGLEMLEVLGVVNFAIIFTTAHDEFAARAFRLSAVDYLLKPIAATDLQEAVKRAAIRLNQQSGDGQISNLLHNIHNPGSQRIAFSSREGFEFVEIGKIIYAHAEGAYTHVFLEGKRKLVISKVLSDIEEMLPASRFLRIHHSTLVNLSHVTHLLKSDGGYVVMDNGEKFAVSKSRKETLMEKLGLK